MSLLESLSPAFGWSALLWVPGMYIFVAAVQAGPVMRARKKFDVQYPNLYAVPGVHKDADAFNAVQRGHQNLLETSHAIQAMALFGSLYSENAAWANVAGAILFFIGSHLYSSGYAKYYNVKGGRYKTGGHVKYIGILTALVTSSMMGLRLAGVIA